MQDPPFISLICLWLVPSSLVIVSVMLSFSLSSLWVAVGLKKYKSKIISFLFASGKDSGHEKVVITLLSVILNRHKANGLSLNISELSKLRKRLMSFVNSIYGCGSQSSSFEVHSLLIDIAPEYIFE